MYRGQNGLLPPRSKGALNGFPRSFPECLCATRKRSGAHWPVKKQAACQQEEPIHGAAPEFLEVQLDARLVRDHMRSIRKYGLNGRPPELLSADGYILWDGMNVLAQRDYILLHRPHHFRLWIGGGRQRVRLQEHGRHFRRRRGGWRIDQPIVRVGGLGRLDGHQLRTLESHPEFLASHEGLPCLSRKYRFP